MLLLSYFFNAVEHAQRMVIFYLMLLLLLLSHSVDAVEHTQITVTIYLMLLLLLLFSFSMQVTQHPKKRTTQQQQHQIKCYHYVSMHALPHSKKAPPPPTTTSDKILPFSVHVTQHGKKVTSQQQQHQIKYYHYLCMLHHIQRKHP